MREVTAVELRQSLGRLAQELEERGEPILLKVGGREVGVIITMRDFRERFALDQAARERAELVAAILGDRRSVGSSIEAALDELRGQ